MTNDGEKDLLIGKCKKANPLFKEYQQPVIPLNNNYYDIYG